jgi:hypothetical protein
MHCCYSLPGTQCREDLCEVDCPGGHEWCLVRALTQVHITIKNPSWKGHQFRYWCLSDCSQRMLCCWHVHMCVLEGGVTGSQGAHPNRQAKPTLQVRMGGAPTDMSPLLPSAYQVGDVPGRLELVLDLEERLRVRDLGALLGMAGDEGSLTVSERVPHLTDGLLRWVPLCST